MKHVAILGASSQIAKDMIRLMAQQEDTCMQLYVRDLVPVQQWLGQLGLGGRCTLHLYEAYGQHEHDAVINFVGVGDPQRAAWMGASIFGITQQYDDMVMAGLMQHPHRRYIFLSSGAAYGSTFLEPAGPKTQAAISINSLTPQEYYSVAKLYAECRHRAHPELAITDIRIFNCFSRTQDIAARFFITDIVRAIRDNTVLQTSPDYMVRDFMHPEDFHQLVNCILNGPRRNGPVDCYTLAPVDKPTLLEAMQLQFGLQYEFVGTAATVVNATGTKPHYYSLNRQAEALGYLPVYSSLDCVTKETASILGRDIF
ncbi:NAD-dependent epimerase/dehydratase family protein [Janthinobacterium sp. LB2P49]|uniref:NAD-dependent epimerase/dehydratase family protein n=1 Tax=Janthinobacterium sp. LB2P49 TaxID=3424198 RepID=UPI003F205128